MRTLASLSLLLSVTLLASCSHLERTLFEPAPPRQFEVPGHLDEPEPEPVVVVEQIKTKGDKDKILGDYVTWGRGLVVQFKELRRLIDKFNDQQAKPKK